MIIKNALWKAHIFSLEFRPHPCMLHLPHLLLKNTNIYKNKEKVQLVKFEWL